MDHLGVILALIGLGVAVVAVPGTGRIEFVVARICLVCAFLLFEAKLAAWGVTEINIVRLGLVALFGAALSVSLVASLYWVSGKEKLAQSPATPTPPTGGEAKRNTRFGQHRVVRVQL
jgi:hypothetical protein